MQNFVSPHVHVKSLDSASSPEQFAKRELELGTGHIVVTDHGTLEATRQVYDLTRDKKAYQGLKPILGIEGYFRDDNCPFLSAAGAPRDEKGKHVGTYAKHLKYCHLTLHALDEQGYYALSRVLSAADLRAEWHGKERKPLFTWENLEELGSHNVTMTSGCLIGMVGRHLVKNNDPHTALRYYDRLRSLVRPGNFYVEIMPHVCDRFWESKVVVDHGDGNVQKYPRYKQFKTHAEPDGIKLGALMEEYRERGAAATRERHREFLEVMEQRVWTPLEKPLGFVSLALQEGEVLNECRGWCPDGDVQLGLNRFLLELAGRYGDPVLLSDDSHFAYPEEKVVQDIRLNQGDDDWRFVNSHHRLDSETAWAYAQAKLGTPGPDFERWVQNTRDWASRFDDFKFSPRKTLPASFYPKDTLRHILELVQRHGRMDWKNPAMVARLTAELDLLTKNGIDLLPYFMIDEEVCRFYLRSGYLTGPGRGSAAGLLLAYLLGITHVDPLRYKLSMDRFMTSDRIKTGKLPDIDQDLPHRHLLISDDGKSGWLKERFGDCVAQISIDNTLRLKSSIKDTFRALERMKTGDRHARVPEAVEEFCKKLETPPQGINDQDYVFGYKDTDGNWQQGEIEKNPALKKFSEDNPKEWDIVCRLLGLARQKSRHACAYVIADEPIQNFIPLMTVSDTRVTSFTAAAVEAAGGLKMDFLVVNSVNDIDCALKLIRSRHSRETWLTDEEGVPYVTIDGKKVTQVRCLPFLDRGSVDIYDLPEDPDVFRDICEGRVETVFQLDAGAARQGLKHFAIEDGGKPPLGSIEALSAFTALDRPGPLDAKPEGATHNFLVEFANRAKGKTAVGRMTILDELLPETYGVIVYQEQLQAIFQQIGETSAIEANNFRGRISKKKLIDVNKIDKPIFMKKALPKLEAAAEVLWGQMQTFGQYGFNKSHATCYMVVAYACAFLKRHYPLEWWTSVLNNAVRRDRNEIDEKFWRYCGHLIDLPDLRHSKPDFVIQNERIRAPLSLLRGLGEKAHAQLLENGPYESITDFIEKIDAWKKRNPLKDKAGNLVLTKAGKQRYATSALNGGVITNLIISGVMDSLFPATDGLGLPMGTPERLSAWAAAKAEVASRGKKRRREVKPVAIEFDWLKDPLANYQARKKVLPAYSASISEILHSDRRLCDAEQAGEKCKAVMTQGRNGDSKGRYWRVVTGPQYEKLGSLDLLPPVDINVALLGYVIAERRFSYKQKSSGENRTACELTVDVDGVRLNMVRWPNKSGLPAAFNQPLQGAVVACLSTRGTDEKNFFFADVAILAPPLSKKTEEATKKAKEEESPDERSP